MPADLDSALDESRASGALAEITRERITPLATVGLWRRKVAARLRVASWRCHSVLTSWRARARSASWRARARSESPTDTTDPGFDLRAYHPIGWRRDHDGGVGALGPPDMLPPAELRGSVRRVGAVTIRRLRRLHHLRDVTGFHADAPRRAGRLVRLAAAGVVVHVADGDRTLARLLGADLYRLVTTDPAQFEDAERELHAVAMRRAALRHHSGWARAQGGEPLPSVSILLATKRPTFLAWALANATRQSYSNCELVLGLHGKGFQSRLLETAALPTASQVLRLPADKPLGGVLQTLSEAASGALLVKMDDDDCYDADHLWDLVLARAYSGAELVGKWLEYIFLAGAGCTVQWRNGASERYQATALNGGALLVGKEQLRDAGGWRHLAAGVDVALAADIARAGGKIYRTHGAGYVLVRHGARHTWNDASASDACLRSRADHVWPGFQPQRAGVRLPPLPHPAVSVQRHQTPTATP